MENNSLLKHHLLERFLRVYLKLKDWFSFMIVPPDFYSIIIKLDGGKATRFDGFFEALKTCAHVSAQPLQIKCNRSLSPGVFLECPNFVTMIPKHKSGSKQKFLKCWPISVRPNLSKNLERTTYTRNPNYLYRSSVCFFGQSGFIVIFQPLTLLLI